MEILETLLAIEEIKRLKARYFRGIDTQDWTMWRDEVFAPLAVLSVPHIGVIVEGAEAIISWVADRWRDRSSVHHGYMPEIDVCSLNEASGRWLMEDRIYVREGSNGPLRLEIHGLGHYHDVYIRLEQGWRINNCVLTRTNVPIHDPNND